MRAIGPMVYGMDISIETHRARETTFDARGEGPCDEPFSAAAPAGEDLDVAELKLMKAMWRAPRTGQKALESHSGDCDRRTLSWPRVDDEGEDDDAQAAFKDR